MPSIRCVMAAIAAAVVATPAARAADPWTVVGPEGGHITALAIDPQHPQTVYAGGSSAGLLKSTDAGATWKRLPGALAGASITALAIDPATPQVLYAGTYAEGLYKSRDAGASWTRIRGDASLQPEVKAIAVDPEHPQTVYFAADNIGPTAGINKTTDGGATWKVMNEGLPKQSRTYAVAVDPKTPSTVYAGLYGNGVYKSTDGAVTWSLASTSLAGNVMVVALAVDPGRPRTIYVATSDDGFHRSDDGGDHWVEANGDLSEFPLPLALTVDPAQPGVVYAGTRGGILASTNGGARWRRLRPGESADLQYTALAIDPTAPETLYAGTDREGIVKSTDGGRRFQARNTGLFGVDVTTLLAAGAAGFLRMGSGDGGLHETVDGGATWTRVEDVDERVRCLIRDPAGNLYAGTDGSIFKRTEGGRGWLPVRRGLPDDVRVGALTFDPRRPERLYALTRSHGMFRSVDAGAHWTAAEAPSPWGHGSRDAYPLVMDPITPETVLTSADYGLWKTGDGGRSWTAAAKTGLPAAEMIALVADPIGKTLYAGFSQAGVYKST
ncbi:MAG TPA: hypothetical protein VFK70_01010, partial [Vicinamibacteria bacterium]|nr:hypothetical protein [Vicinamibacteria bacterium]